MDLNMHGCHPFTTALFRQWNAQAVEDLVRTCLELVQCLRVIQLKSGEQLLKPGECRLGFRWARKRGGALLNGLDEVQAEPGGFTQHFLQSDVAMVAASFVQRMSTSDMAELIEGTGNLACDFRS
ncbi:hypothetical protein JRI60_47640 [Archangium violaceum]|uniref:hypothetical protein n=1 Tax=Archangium violaceum TaxID=83451 RepID=UPI00194FA34D|nr:hypothetical protein [Archangium violaceum]QRN96593.1 hypothetical protein JRI60_47640 [Archangium violaceum]